MFWADPPLPTRVRQRLPDVPVDLLRQVGAAALRRRESLVLAPDGSLAILGRSGAQVDSQFREDLVVGLDNLFTEAGDRLRTDQPTSLPHGRIPAIRTICVKVARGLAAAGSSEEAVRRWSDAARNEPLPSAN